MRPAGLSSQTKPPWLKVAIPPGGSYLETMSALQKMGVNTVCLEARCPNMAQCFSKGTATFLILGPKCTRNCRFCGVEQGPEFLPPPDEPRRVAETAAAMGLDYVVVTSVCRDDLADKGAGQFAITVKEIRRKSLKTKVELLIPDFRGAVGFALDVVLEEAPDLIAHNMETVQRLYPKVRPQADYQGSLRVLAALRAKAPDLPIKSGLMLGLGESPQEVRDALYALLDSGCNVITLGQYLQPSKRHLSVERYLPPEEFVQWKEEALGLGFEAVASGPLVRSSYQAKELFLSVVKE